VCVNFFEMFEVCHVDNGDYAVCLCLNQYQCLWACPCLCLCASSLLLQGCSLLQCVAICCSVLKRVVVSVSVSVCDFIAVQCVKACCSVSVCVCV